MERFRVVDEKFIAEPQGLPAGFDNIDSARRAELLREFNHEANTHLGLNLTEISVAWDMYSRVPKEDTAERLGVHTAVVEGIRIDVRSWEARGSLLEISQTREK